MGFRECISNRFGCVCPHPGRPHSLRGTPSGRLRIRTASGGLFRSRSAETRPRSATPAGIATPSTPGFDGRRVRPALLRKHKPNEAAHRIFGSVDPNSGASLARWRPRAQPESRSRSVSASPADFSARPYARSASGLRQQREALPTPVSDRSRLLSLWHGFQSFEILPVAKGRPMSRPPFTPLPPLLYPTPSGRIFTARF